MAFVPSGAAGVRMSGGGGSRMCGRVRELLSSDGVLQMPCCYDALSARLIERAQFPLTFMSGFATSAARHALPDTGLLSFAEMRDNLSNITPAVHIPVIADADTGFGNAVNVRRTVHEYYRAGAAGLLIEDQVNPKRYVLSAKLQCRVWLFLQWIDVYIYFGNAIAFCSTPHYSCGHTKGKEVVSRQEALERVRAACDARDEIEHGGPIIIARTDAGHTSFEEALIRARLFHEAGADVTFVEAPTSIEQMQLYCDTVPGHKLANMLEMGKTPILPPHALYSMGYKIVAYPLTLISAAVHAQENALHRLKNGQPIHSIIKHFDELCDIVGFPEYYAQEQKYKHWQNMSQ